VGKLTVSLIKLRIEIWSAKQIDKPIAGLAKAANTRLSVLKSPIPLRLLGKSEQASRAGT
jgi:hypothetical protein